MTISMPASRPFGSAPVIVSLSESASVVVSTLQASFSSTFCTFEHIVPAGSTK